MPARTDVANGAEPTTLAEEIADFLHEPQHFYDVLQRFPRVPQRTALQAWSLLRQAGRLVREEKSGKYLLKR
jgi:hypothetical protein